MKIRDRRLIAAAGWLGTRMVTALASTLRFEFRSLGPIPLDPAGSPSNQRLIYTLWHENFLVPIIRCGHHSTAALVSSHTDGQLLGTLIRSTGMGVVHGSTRRGGIAAVRKLLRDDIGHRNLAVTPDGPRGPRRVVQPGVVYLASRTGMRIVPLGVGHRRPWRVNSWDAFAIPRPFSRVRCLFGEPITVPPHLSSEELEPYRQKIQNVLDGLTRSAQDWAEQGVLDLPPRIHEARLTVPVVQHPHRQALSGATNS